MIEAITGTGLAAAAGLNAYIPMLALGLLSRFTDVVTLPAGWSWLALTVHLGKAGTRAVANTATVGVTAPVLSTVEDITSVALVAAAILLPALVAVLLIALVVGIVLLVRRARCRRAQRRNGDLAPTG